MRRQLLVSTATAALLSGLVFATAQEMPRGGGKQESPTQSQGSPSGAQRGESRQGMPQRQDNMRGNQAQRGQGESEQGKGKQAQPKPERSQPQTTGQGQREQGQREQGKAKQQAQPKPDRNRDQRTTGQGQREQRDQDKARQQAQPKTERGTDQTVGQGREQDRTSAQGRSQLSVEQRTRIQQTVFARSDLPRVDNVNFRVSVGTVVPARVRAVVVPAEIVEIRPQFRNHLFFVVHDEIVILDNRRRIVEVIPVGSAGGRGAAVRGSRTDVFVDLSPDEIREVQRVLIQRGFSVEIDGRLGPRTRQALIQFQRREGLQVTGRIDNRTISSLGVSVRSNQSGGGQQPSTSGQGGANQGRDAAQQPSPSNQGAREPQRSPQDNQSGAGKQGKSGTNRQNGQNQNPSTTGQGDGMNQNQPNQGSGAGQGASNPAAKQPSSSGGATGSAGGSPPSDQRQQPK